MPTIPPYFQVEQTPLNSNPTPTTTTAQTPQSPSSSSHPTHKFPCPKLRLHFNDTSVPGTSLFLTHTKGHTDLSTQIQSVLSLLYHPSDPRPGTRSVTFILRPLDGVAYTTGLELDSDHKEIHFNTSYIEGVAARNKGDAAAIRHEVLGVLCHELVHCFQWSAEGTCPGGLIEGVADWVRLRAGLGASHWKQEADGKWDGGYQHTGYFLDYLEERFGEGTVRRMNGCLRKGEYDEKKLFGDCCKGHKVKELWEDYGKHLKKTQTATSPADPAGPIPTHPAMSDRTAS